MSDSNRVRLSYVAEATYGVEPASPALIDLRITGESLKQTTNTVQSQELRSDRNIADNLRVGVSADGDVNFELSCIAAGAQDTANMDNWWLYAIGAAGYSTAIGSISTILGTWASSGAGTFAGTLTRTDNGNFDTIPVGRWIRVTSAVIAANCGWYKVTAVVAGANGSITVAGFKDITAGTENAGGAQIRCHRMALNGTTNVSMTIVKQYPDLTNEFEIYNGYCVERASLDVSNDKIITGSFGLSGSKAQSSTVAGSGTPTYVPVPTSAILTGVANVVGIMENNKPIAATGFTLQIQNNLRNRQIIGTLGAISVGQGSIVVTGTLKCYFSNSTLLGADVSTIIDKYLAATPSSLSIVVAENPTSASLGNYQIWDMQQVKYTSGQVLSTAINGDVMIELAWQALLETTEPEGSYTIRYTRG